MEEPFNKHVNMQEPEPADVEEFTLENQAEMNMLNMTKTQGRIKDEEGKDFVWIPEVHQPRLNALEEKKKKWQEKNNPKGLTPEQEAKLNELSQLQNTSKEDLPEELRQELAYLYGLKHPDQPL